ncbi:MAG: hypothetical protein H6722_11435 [Sandaracinus sp.]|nr:hypothetical protein [Sandaracinus sp.]
MEWTWKCQVAAALLVTKLDAGWNGSERRSGLCAMVHGPIDWTISAALPCLGLVYAECPEARDELRQIFDALRQRVPDIGYACYRAPLEAVTMRLPGRRREGAPRGVDAAREGDAEALPRLNSTTRPTSARRRRHTRALRATTSA